MVHAVLIAVVRDRKLLMTHKFIVEVHVYHNRAASVLVLIEVHYVGSVHQKIGRPFRVERKAWVSLLRVRVDRDFGP